MGFSPRSTLHGVPLLLAVLSLAGIVALLAWDIRPQYFPANSHAVLGAFPLAMIGFAWLARQAFQNASCREWLKASLLAAAFFFWAANQCVRDAHAATICNDIAIALFVLDLVVVIAPERPVDSH
jgi:hypothetical protein